jgi:hypothetical protein
MLMVQSTQRVLLMHEQSLVAEFSVMGMLPLVVLPAVAQRAS